MAGAHSRRKGAGAEREIVQLAKSFGLRATRTWETAQSREGGNECDVRIGVHPFQVKRRASGFKFLYDSLQNVTGSFVRQDNAKWLAVVPAELFLRMFEYFHRES
jgi:hypothetical protein